ncbi:MAG TPA: hypothetical protein VEP46_04175 [Vicinamibacterales bacterium]|nr:hypothetical protein [Vicinamibacterales bacterium]
MNCFTHTNRPAAGICSICQKAICHECVGRDAPRLVCRECLERSAVMFGWEYKSAATIAGWPLVHICAGMDPVTMRPRAAKGVIAIGNIAIGGLALGGVAVGLISLGGLSVGIAAAFGGLALGLGVSVGGVAIGSIAFGGLAIGFKYAIGGGAFGPSVIDGRRCDEAARELWSRWLGARSLPPPCNQNPFRLIR